MLVLSPFLKSGFAIETTYLPLFPPAYMSVNPSVKFLCLSVCPPVYICLSIPITLSLWLCLLP